MKASKNTTDILIIGAGASGLAAGFKLTEAGKQIVILEARPRTGGRIYTRHLDNTPHAVELGAEFIHGRPGELLELIPELEKSVTYEIAEQRYKLNNQKLNLITDFWDNVIEVLSGLKSAVRSKDISLSEYLDSRHISSSKKKLIKDFIEGFDAADAKKISARSLKNMPDELKQGDERMARCLHGYDSILQLFEKKAQLAEKIYLNTVVQKVIWRKGHVKVITCQNGNANIEWEAKKILITVPVGVLKAAPGQLGHIQFEPNLPIKEKALTKIEMGPVIKLVLQFDSEFFLKWQPQDQYGFIHLTSNEPFQVIWTFAPVKAPIFTFWTGGPMTKKIEKLNETELIDLALACMQKIFKLRRDFLKKHLRQHFFNHWKHDPFARGAYSYLAVDGLESQKEMTKPEKNTIYFSGEAINPDGTMGTVDAAIASAYAAVKKILKS